MRPYYLFAVLTLFMHSLTSFAQSNYEKAWQELNKNNRQEASVFLKAAIKEPTTATDAFLTNVYLEIFNGNSEKITDFSDRVYDKMDHPDPYVYALWFGEPVLGDYAKKSPHQLLLANRIINNEKSNGTLKASAYYQLGNNQLFSNKMETAADFYNKIGSIQNWQYAGPFENISESGFYKSYDPVIHPEPEAVFKSTTGGPVQWFTPAYESKEGWMPILYVIPENTAVSYAQTFIDVPETRDALIGLGVSGNVKLWINDRLLISESKERLTDYDAYTVKYRLQKGINRVLVQLGYTNNTYPYFGLRITDATYAAFNDISSSFVYKPYLKDNGTTPTELMPHFAEDFFKQKIAKDSSNLLNYLLLSSSYFRSKKLEEARQIINLAQAKAPNNSLLLAQSFYILSTEGNETLAQEDAYKLKVYDSTSLPALNLTMDELQKNEKYTELEEKLKLRKKLYPKDEKTLSFELSLLAQKNKLKELFEIVELLYKEFPDRVNVQTAMYNVRKEVDKDPERALKVYESFFKHNYHPTIYNEYCEALLSQGKNEQFITLKQSMIKAFPFSSSAYTELANYYFSKKEYSKAEELIKKTLALSPTNATHWKSLGNIKMQTNSNADAIAAYKKSLSYDPNQYDLIANIRKLEGKPESYQLFKTINEEAIVQADNNAPQKSEYGYYFLLDQKDVVIYENGAKEQFITYMIKIVNEDGVERYKEVELNQGSQNSILIEKAEIIKKGKRIQGERNGNEVVFANLEPTDVILIRYRLQSFESGRFANEFTDSYLFDGAVFCGATRYNLIAPEHQKFNFLFSKEKIAPITTTLEHFKKYSWEVLNTQPINSEPLMPVLSDIGNTLHISTISDWSQISKWYSDIVNYSDVEYEVREAYKQIFPKNLQLPDEFSKAKQIYDFIEHNVRYSSVSFRQGAYVPQKASKTLITRLGDCKDLSKLFVTLCDIAGIRSNMVLVDTRDNGEKQMLLPSMNFNHCIVKANLDGKDYFIELTDNNLPFASLPVSLQGATILEIPHANAKIQEGITYLKSNNRKKESIIRNIEIKPKDSDLEYNMTVIRSGAITSGARSEFRYLDNEKRFKLLEENIAGNYETSVKLKSLDFAGLEKLADSVTCKFSYLVKDQVSEIGSLQAFKPNFHDDIITLNSFSKEERAYPIEYWNYETVDNYQTNVTIFAPENKKFNDVPDAKSFVFNNMKYSITYKVLSPGKLSIVRSFSNDRPSQISAKDYAAFKTFAQNILKAEQRFITYK